MTNNTEDVESISNSETPKIEDVIREAMASVHPSPEEWSGTDEFKLAEYTQRAKALLQQEANRQKIELLDEIYQKWGGDESLKHFTITAGEEVLLAEIKHRREQLEGGR